MLQRGGFVGNCVQIVLCFCTISRKKENMEGITVRKVASELGI